jgi:hypothetical protein
VIKHKLERFEAKFTKILQIFVKVRSEVGSSTIFCVRILPGQTFSGPQHCKEHLKKRKKYEIPCFGYFFWIVGAWKSFIEA